MGASRATTTTVPAAAPATEDLVRAARGGDREAFGELIRRHERMALAVAYAATGGDAGSAGDVTQEAFLRAWRRLDALADDGRFAGWLCGIVRNAAADLRRSNRKHAGDAPPSARPAVETHASAAPGAELDRRETAEQIDAALDRLDDLSRSAVVLRYYEGRSSASIAELLGTTPAAVHMRLSRARVMLREWLTRSGVAPERAATNGTEP